MNINDEILKSQALFKRMLIETPIKHIIGGDIAFLECNDQYAQFDLTAGLDNIEINHLGVRGIAYRNLTNTKYRTITIRWSIPSGNPTEYAKRLFALNNKHLGYIYPYWTVNSYTENDQFAYFFVMETEKLIYYIHQNSHLLPKIPGPNGVEFVAVPYEKLANLCFGLEFRKDVQKWFYLPNSLRVSQQ